MTTRGPGLTKVWAFASRPHPFSLLTRSGPGRKTVVSGRQDSTRTSIQQTRITHTTGSAQLGQDEELHLLASRRKLLARNDWLALDQTRPLRIGFPTTGDKDRVGRRRKVKKSSATRSKAVHQRLLTPLFEERLDPNAYLMSGALPPAHDDHIEIKVGTSAFDTQSRPSRRSNTPRNVSTGAPAPSTGFSHLIEESMLLGVDGDTFDADQVEVPTHVHERHREREDTIRPTSFEFESPTELEDEERHSSCTPEHIFALHDDPELQQYRVSSDDADAYVATSPHHRAEQIVPLLQAGYYAAPDDNIWDTVDAQRANNVEHTNRNVPRVPFPAATPTEQDATELDAEQAWRQMMGIATLSESLTSNKALDSSSQHMTTSDITQRVVPGGVQHEASVGDVLASTSGIGNSSLEHIGQASPTQVHELLVKGKQHPARSPQTHQHSPDNEALWREFIIGSQDSESGDELHSAWQRSRGRNRQSSEQPRSLQLSGLGTSDQATRGEAAIYSPNLFAPQDTSVGNAFELDEDSIEEFPLDVSPNPGSPRNIHATSAKRLDPRRFKASGESFAATTRRDRQEHAVSQRYSLRRRTRGSKGG